jgi:hypothetical protein
MSQDDAVVLFRNSATEVLADETGRDFFSSTKAHPIIQMFNPALKQLTGIDIQVEKLSLSVEFPELFAELPDLDVPAFQVKTQKD